MQTILITGSKGQLGNEMQMIASKFPQYSYLFTDVDELDILDETAVTNFFDLNSIDYVVNCAAYTAVDQAESDAEKALLLNEGAVGILGKNAARVEAKMIHVSTDYVFDGRHYLPYTEEMPVCPATVYGRSKLAGENSLLSHCSNAVVIRTSWLYSSFGSNFVKTMLKLGRERKSLQVVFDQIGTPTYAADLANAIMQIISSDQFVPGIYHYSNEGVCSWYDFAKSIHKIADISCEVLPVESKDYPAKTPRPHYSVLNKKKIKDTYKLHIPHWEESLKCCIIRLHEAN